MRALPAFASVVVGLALAGCDFAVNQDVEVDAGGRSSGAYTVNGRVRVGADAVVDGGLRTVNGSVEVERGARVRDVNTVNGSIRLGDGVKAGTIAGVNARVEFGERVETAGDVGTVNGRIGIGGSSIVHGDVRTVNGDIVLRGTRVAGDVANHLGDVRLLDGTLIEGDLVLEKPDHSEEWVSNVVIGVGAQVRGTVRAARPIKLFVHPTAKLGGVEGATAQPFQGTDVESP